MIIGYLSFGRVPGCLGLGALFLWDEWRDERTVCQRGGCMVVPGAVVSPGHTRRLRRLSCRAPHNSPCTLMRTWLRQMGLILRPVSAEYLSTGHLTLTFPETNPSPGKNIKKSSTNDDRLNTLRYSIFLLLRSFE